MMIIILGNELGHLNIGIRVINLIMTVLLAGVESNKFRSIESFINSFAHQNNLKLILKRIHQ